MMKILISISLIGLLISCTSKKEAPVDLNNLKTQGCSIEKPKDCDKAEDLLNGNKKGIDEKTDAFDLKK